MGTRYAVPNDMAISNILFLILSCVAHGTYIDTSTCGNNIWSVTSDVSGVSQNFNVDTSTVLRNTSARGLVECSGFCIKTYDCVSVVYDKEYQTCQLLSMAVKNVGSDILAMENTARSALNFTPVMLNRAGKVNTPLLCLDSPCSDVVRCRVDCYNNQAICIGDALDCDDELPISNIVIGSWYGMLLQDEGDVLSLNYEKKRLDTGLKLYYSGNLRAGRQCEHCCARWFFVIDTMECSNPGSIEFQEYHVHKRTHQMHGEFGGVCEDVSPGLHKIILRIGPCVGHELGDQLTGWNSQYFIRIEEVDLRSKTALCPSWTVFNIKQYTSLISNTIDQDNAVLMSFNYTKRASDTALRVTWNGMLGQYSVGNMCNRWYFTFNGQECSDPDTISTIVAFLAGSTNWGRRSYTLDGLCKGLGSGNILIEFRIGFCEDGSTPGDAYTGHSAGESIPLAKVLVEETRLGQDINAVLKPDGRVVQLPVFNRQYWSWRQTISTNSQTVLKSFTYFKRSKTSSLHVVYTFVGKIQGEHRCARWFIMFNGTECTRPGRIEHTSYQGQLLYGDTVWHIPSVCDGTCHGLPMGTVEVGILVTVCDMHPNMAVSCTGWNAKQSLMVEETYLQT